MKNILVIVGIVVIVLLVLYFKNNSSSKSTTNNIASTSPTTQTSSSSTPTPTQTIQNIATDKLIIEDIKVGDGQTTKVGDTIEVNYLGTLTNGTKFDSSYDRNQSFSFSLGGGQVIQGWDQGLVGMKVGGKRKLTIPASLGYGAQAVGTIPANSTLIFEVELLSIK